MTVFGARFACDAGSLDSIWPRDIGLNCFIRYGRATSTRAMAFQRMSVSPGSLTLIVIITTGGTVCGGLARSFSDMLYLAPLDGARCALIGFSVLYLATLDARVITVLPSNI